MRGVTDVLWSIFQGEVKFCQFNPLRRLCITVTEDPNFDRIVIGFILANTVCLALESPSFLQSHAEIMEQLDLIFFIIFWIEFAFKYLAQGFTKYASKKVNIVDFIVLIGTSVELALRSETLVHGAMDSWRLFRILRVCRLVHLAKKIHGLHVVIKVLYKCLPMVFATGILSFQCC